MSSRLTAFCTTRIGGVSLPPYDSLNLGLHVADDYEHVRENRRRLEASFALPSTPAWLNQTHSANVVPIQDDADQGEPMNADGAWTTRQGCVLAVLTADCLPVVLCDEKAEQVAVVHAGWRGLAAGILENAVATFPADVHVHAWLGPAIGPDAFQVGADVRVEFMDRFSGHEAAFLPDEVAGKYKANLYALARTELLNARSVTVSGGEYCTFSQSNWFHSHRRDGVRSGRMATVAWINTAS